MRRSILATAQPATAPGYDALDRRDRMALLLASSVLTGGALRSIAAVAGMMTVLGVSPAFAQCFSGTFGNITGAGCDVTAATGVASTAVGLNSNATGNDATAYGTSATANGFNATATGAGRPRTAITRPRPAPSASGTAATRPPSV